jgi:hypothetical protein
MARDRRQCKIFAAMDDDGLTHATVAYIWDDRYAYYFLSSRNRDQAHLGAVSLLLWTGIKLAHSRGLWLDFDGGLIKHGRYKFLVAFGGQVANRFEVMRSTSLYQIRRNICRIPRAIRRRLWIDKKNALFDLEPPAPQLRQRQ